MDKELLDILQGKDETTEPKKEFKEITLKFGKGCVGDEFQGKDGNSYRQIMIPPNEEVKQPWQTFVVKANQVHENQYGKGMWCKLPADGSTTVTDKDAVIRNVYPGPTGGVKGTEIPVCMSNTPELVYVLGAASMLGAVVNVFSVTFSLDYIKGIRCGKGKFSVSD